TLAEGIAANQQVRWRNLVSSRTGMQVASAAVREAAFWTTHNVVAGAFGSESVIAIGDDVGHGDRLGPLFFERGNLVAQFLSPGAILRRHRPIQGRPGDGDRCQALFED